VELANKQKMNSSVAGMSATPATADGLATKDHAPNSGANDDDNSSSSSSASETTDGGAPGIEKSKRSGGGNDGGDTELLTASERKQVNILRGVVVAVVLAIGIALASGVYVVISRQDPGNGSNTVSM